MNQLAMPGTRARFRAAVCLPRYIQMPAGLSEMAAGAQRSSGCMQSIVAS
eukprot:CAMPEP_0206029000 /NCGR_PEP_ID=MMETSP1464-20131121/45961_1 /ASSEMBLY_ACC=CAM_ASM_001124 /TAXON_ID=119497 /ORGANISM="Exanthemachrysis gayraliae, Strain RCC1523" /LENGTH=49 /DNA_ID= /DNA_START= /DNA_END= /DNA_ORIENTATION=